jgi:hypothetical protein
VVLEILKKLLFKELKISLQCSQKPATGLCPELDECHITYGFQLILSFHICLGLPIGPFLPGLPATIYMLIYLFRVKCSAFLRSLCLIASVTFGEEHKNILIVYKFSLGTLHNVVTQIPHWRSLRSGKVICSLFIRSCL